MSLSFEMMVAGVVLTLLLTEGAMAVSQFQNDASFSIVDTDLAVPTPTTVLPTGAGTTASSRERERRWAPTTAPIPTLGPTAPISTLGPTASTSELLLVELNPVSGFDQPKPVLLRGDGGLNPESGIFHIVDDGYYVFIVHKVGYLSPDVALTLTRVPVSDSTANITLATLEDLATNTIHVVAELERGDLVLIANPKDAVVTGDEDNPFIYNAFLLGHKPITAFPRVRQSAFSVTVNGNLTEAGTPFSDYNDPALDVGDDFDAVEGVYLAPFKGLYVFHLAATFDPARPDRPTVALAINGAERGRVQVKFIAGPPMRKNAALTIAHRLDQGDSVQLLNVVSSPDTGCLATLAGYLLS